MVQASSSDAGKNALQFKQNVESSIVSLPRTWPAGVTVVSLLAVAGVGIAALIHFSRAITEVAVLQFHCPERLELVCFDRRCCSSLDLF
jgi:hypothetical protein